MFNKFAPLFIFMESNPETMPTTNIRVDLKTRDRLAKLGKYGDSMDTILVRVIDYYEDGHKHETKK